MQRNRNIRFIEEYIVLDDAMSRHTKNKRGGVAGYIEALKSQKLDTGATSTLAFLKKCQSVRNALAHSPGAIRSSSAITSSDLRRIKKLRRALALGRDPLTVRRSRTAKIRIALAIAIFFVAVFALTVIFA